MPDSHVIVEDKHAKGLELAQTLAERRHAAFLQIVLTANIGRNVDGMCSAQVIAEVKKLTEWLNTGNHCNCFNRMMEMGKR